MSTEYQAANSEPMPFASAKYLERRIHKGDYLEDWPTHLTYKVLVFVCFDSAIEPQNVIS